MPNLPAPFTANAANSVKQLGTRPVFKVDYGISHDAFILKTETSSVQVSQDVTDFTYQAMREVAEGTKSRPLNTTEINEVYTLLHSQKADQACRQYAPQLGMNAAAYAARPWVIMSFKKGLIALDEALGKDPNNTTPERDRLIGILSSMRHEKNLKRLGAMLVVDLFLNNEDRFSLRKSQKGIGGSGLENFGNVFFVEKGLGFFQIKALDPWDIAKPDARIDQVVAKPKTFAPQFRDMEQWTGMFLKKDDELFRIADNACDVFNLQIAAALNRLGVSPSDYEPYLTTKETVKQVHKAMKDAIPILKGYCRTRAGAAGARFYSAGLQSRMELLGWA